MMSSSLGTRRVSPRKAGFIRSYSRNLGAVTVGDWICDCGQSYRVVVEGGYVRMWPQCAADDFSERPIDGSCVCGVPIDPGRVALTIEGRLAPQAV
jgi:hypothetical protein